VVHPAAQSAGFHARACELQQGQLMACSITISSSPLFMASLA